MLDKTDEHILECADAQMSEQDNTRMSELLYLQQAQALSAQEASELSALMELYQQGLLNKAQAIREAVRRGLRDPIRS